MRRLFLTAILLCLGVASGFAQQNEDQARISNVFTDADVRAVLSEIASACGVTIIPDSSVKGLELNLELKDDTVESALEKVALFGGFVWKKKSDVYLVSTGLPDAPLFSEFAVTRAYSPKTQAAESLFALLAKQFQTLASIDRNANLISITGPERYVEKVIAALEEVDRPREQFVVEALVTEVRQDKGKEHGFSWSWNNFGQSGDLGLSYAKASSADIVKIKSLIANGNAEMRANPRVVAMVGKEALITVGNESYFPVVTGSSTLQTTTLQRISTGITLKIMGFVEPDGTLNLRLQPEVSDAVAQVNGAPTTTVRRVDTFVRVKSGETIVVGGLVVDTKLSKSSKVPMLGDLPLVGALFQKRSDVSARTEVVIMITPRLVRE